MNKLDVAVFVIICLALFGILSIIHVPIASADIQSTNYSNCQLFGTCRPINSGNIINSNTTIINNFTSNQTLNQVLNTGNTAGSLLVTGNGNLGNEFGIEDTLDHFIAVETDVNSENYLFGEGVLNISYSSTPLSDFYGFVRLNDGVEKGTGDPIDSDLIFAGRGVISDRFNSNVLDPNNRLLQTQFAIVANFSVLGNFIFNENITAPNICYSTSVNCSSELVAHNESLDRIWGRNVTSPNFVYNGTEFLNRGNTTGWLNMSGSVLLWHLNETSGTFSDTSGSGNTGTLNSTTPGRVKGILNNSASFDSNSYVVSLNNYTETANFSLSFWMNTTQSGAFGRLAGTNGNNSGGWLIILNADGTLGFDSTLSSGVNSAVTVNDGGWHNIVATRYANSSYSLYVDGALQGSSNRTFAVITNHQFTLGIDGSFKPQKYTGNIDEVSLWNRTLSSTEITTIYNTQKAQLNGTTAAADTIITIDNRTTVSGGTFVNGTYSGTFLGITPSPFTNDTTYILQVDTSKIFYLKNDFVYGDSGDVVPVTLFGNDNNCNFNCEPLGLWWDDSQFRFEFTDNNGYFADLQAGNLISNSLATGALTATSLTYNSKLGITRNIRIQNTTLTTCIINISVGGIYATDCGTA